MTRSILARLIALAVITAAGVYYIAADVLNIGLWNGPYTIHVVMPNAGGLYTDAYVTYRGVEIGKVKALHLEPDDVVADLSIDHGTRIPIGSTASVRQLTAVAEQYMDLVPPSAKKGNRPSLDAAGYMAPGATIPEQDTTVPTSIGTLLDNLDSLVGSLNTHDLDNLTSTLATGLAGTGGDLHEIIANGDTLVSALQSAIPGTEQLINAGASDLATFNSTSDDFHGFATNIDDLTAQVAASNHDLVALLRNGSSASRSISNFLDTNADPTVSMINRLSAVTGVAYQREPAINALFEVLPVVSNDLAETTSGSQLHFELKYNTADPVCPYTTRMVEPTSLVAVASLTGNCGTDAPDLLQRGADKAPPPRR